MDGGQLSQQYKNHLSGFPDWDQLGHAEEWILFPDNIGERLCLDEVALSEGELYTVLTNANAACREGSLVAMVKGVRSADLCKVFKKLPFKSRMTVKEVSLDMANNMEKTATECFLAADLVTDRFHVAKLITEAVQEIRIKHRWEAIAIENQMVKQAREKGERYKSPVFHNGDTRKQLLARSRHLLFKPSSKWTTSQTERAGILFREYPEIMKAYHTAMNFRNIYQQAKSKKDANRKLNEWMAKVNQDGVEPFITAANSVESHRDTILNYFTNRTTNALAESFNSKIKAFRGVFRGVRDIDFFLYRLSLIYA